MSHEAGPVHQSPAAALPGMILAAALCACQQRMPCLTWSIVGRPGRAVGFLSSVAAACYSMGQSPCGSDTISATNS